MAVTLSGLSPLKWNAARPGDSQAGPAYPALLRLRFLQHPGSTLTVAHVNDSTDPEIR